MHGSGVYLFFFFFLVTMGGVRVSLLVRRPILWSEVT